MGWNNKIKIFITGATGFLGSNLVKILTEQGKEVTIFVRKGSDHPFLKGLNIDRVHGDITDYPSINKVIKGCTHVYHAAGYLSYSRIHINKLMEINVKGTENVCRAAVENNITKLVHVSSTSAIGIPKYKEKPADETHLFNKRWKKNPYMMTKRLSEEVALGFVDKGLNVVVVNPSTFYGPGDIKIHSGEVFRNIASGTLRIAPPGGTGIISIMDCVQGLIAAMERGEKGQRYILNSENLTLIQLFNTIAHVLDKPPIIKILPRWTYYPLYLFAFIMENIYGVLGKDSKIDCGTIDMSWRYRYFNSSKAHNELQWKPKLSFQETCKSALNFYRSIGAIDYK